MQPRAAEVWNPAGDDFVNCEFGNCLGADVSPSPQASSPAGGLCLAGREIFSYVLKVSCGVEAVAEGTPLVKC